MLQSQSVYNPSLKSLLLSSTIFPGWARSICLCQTSSVPSRAWWKIICKSHLCKTLIDEEQSQIINFAPKLLVDVAGKNIRCKNLLLSFSSSSSSPSPSRVAILIIIINLASLVHAMQCSLTSILLIIAVRMISMRRAKYPFCLKSQSPISFAALTF